MKLFQNVFPPLNNDGEVLACFGRARLVKHLDGSLELLGGSPSDHTEAKEWLSLFFHEAVVRGVGVGTATGG